MGARDRSQDRDYHDENGAGRNRVAEQRDGLVSAREPLGHDAGADHGGDENGRAESLGDEPPGERVVHCHAAEAGSCPASFVLPIASSWRWSDN